MAWNAALSAMFIGLGILTKGPVAFLIFALTFAVYLVVKRFKFEFRWKDVAMDAARTALRLGNEVYIIYRRDENEMPARKEEVHHAKEEGIIFDVLTNPVEVIQNESGWVSGIKCVKMKFCAVYMIKS